MQKPISLKTFNRLVDMLTIIEQSPPEQQTFSSNELARNLGVSGILDALCLIFICLTVWGSPWWPDLI